MKISYNWLKTYVSTDLPPAKVAELLTNTGLEVEGTEKVESVKGGLEGVVVGEVLSCEQHPNADRLKVTSVNVGAAEPLQIVCGAPNVAVGQKVPVATPGTTLYAGEKPFTIKKSKLRGEVSNGMICAEDELGLGSSHDGIMILDENAGVGMPAAEYFKIESDVIFEIGLTPNRTDAMSHYGVARDLRAALLRFDYPTPALNLPSVAAFTESSRDLPIQIEVEATDDCYRYCGVSLQGVRVESSPKWLQNRLRAIGISPINNVVDVTNFVLHECGHPLHAFDIDKIAEHKIIVKKAKEGASFTTLDERERKLSAEDLMICDAEKELVLAGVMGGTESGVTADTTSVFLEAAHFNPVSVRKTAKRHALSTDSSFRYERGIDPEMTLYALKRAALLIRDIAGGEIAMSIRDVEPHKVARSHEIVLNLDRMYKLLGQKIELKQVRDILNWLEIRVSAESGGDLHLRVPAYRHDVRREADVVEEILRIYGFNAIELPQAMRISVAPRDPLAEARQRDKISQNLAARGFLEMINNSLSHGKYYEGNGFRAEHSVAIINPLSQDLGVLRQSLLFGGLEAISYNQKRQRSHLRFFEFGRQYSRESQEYREKPTLALWSTGEERPENWKYPAVPSDFYTLKAELSQLLQELGLTRFREKKCEESFLVEGLSLEVQKKTVGFVGRLSASVCQQFDIDTEVHYAQLDWELLVELASKQRVKYRQLPRFPEVRRDLALLLDTSVNYAELEKTAWKAGGQLLKAVNLFDVYEGKHLPEGKKSYALSFKLQHEERTLKDAEVDKVMAKITEQLQKTSGASLR